MAFTGTPVVTLVSDSLCRITGVSLLAGATGSIGLAVNTTGADVLCPAGFQPAAYADVELSASCQVSCVSASNNVGASTAPPSIGKSGATPALFVCTVENIDGANPTNDLELYIRFH